MGAAVRGPGPGPRRHHVPGDDRRGAGGQADRRARGCPAGDAARVLPRRRVTREQSRSVPIPGGADGDDAGREARVQPGRTRRGGGDQHHGVGRGPRVQVVTTRARRPQGRQRRRRRPRAVALGDHSRLSAQARGGRVHGGRDAGARVEAQQERRRRGALTGVSKEVEGQQDQGVLLRNARRGAPAALADASVRPGFNLQSRRRPTGADDRASHRAAEQQRPAARDHRGAVHELTQRGAGGEPREEQRGSAQ